MAAATEAAVAVGDNELGLEVDMSAGPLFFDASFPADESSLYDLSESDVIPMGVENIDAWLRPSEYARQPTLVEDGVQAGDVVQGGLGDCWFLGAVATLGTRLEYLKKVFSYMAPLRGEYRLRFFLNARWEEVVIDDRIPCDKEGVPVFSRCSSLNELWVPLLEKAYAKVHGTYQTLERGLLRDALCDLTGGISGKVDLDTSSVDDVWQVLSTTPKAYTRLLGAVAFGSRTGEEEGELGNTGLLVQHAYGIMRTLVIDGVRLVQLRNPWGLMEWKGAWSDGSAEWTDARAAAADQSTENDGLFWMSIDDFCTHFDEVDICKIFPEGRWHSQSVTGRWEGSTAAGKFYTHPLQTPQFLLTVPASVGRCVAVVALRQKEARYTGDDKLCNVHMAFQLMRAPHGERVLAWDESTCLVNSDPWIDAREIARNVVLEPGQYVIAVSTFEPQIESDYMVRVLMTSPQFSLRALPPVRDQFDVTTHESAWAGAAAAGCTNTWRWIDNPQFALTVAGTQAVRVTLKVAQDDTATAGGWGRYPHHAIYVLPALAVGGPTTLADPVLDKGAFSDAREITVSGTLDPGTYRVVPATYHAGQEAQFTLRCFVPLHDAPRGTVTLAPVEGWSMQELSGAWGDTSAGGCNNNDSWTANPRIAVTIPGPANGHLTMVLAKAHDTCPHAIGFLVCDPETVPDGQPEGHPGAILAQTAAWTSADSNAGSFELAPGTYQVVPCTFNPGELGEWIFRVYAPDSEGVRVQAL